MRGSLDPPTRDLSQGKYRIDTLLGRSETSSVWSGQNTVLGTPVTIELIEAERANDAAAQKRFESAVRAAASLRSKHVVEVLDHGVTPEGCPFVVMESLDGESLARRLERVGRSSLEETARIVEQASQAVSLAHERGIIHRRLTAERVFLVRSPGADSAGAVKVMGIPAAAMQTSPDLDRQPDFRSLGVMALRCLTGTLPADDAIPTSVLPSLPSAFDEWFARAFEREPGRRFATARDLAAALTALANAANVTPAGAGSDAPVLVWSNHSSWVGGGGSIKVYATRKPFEVVRASHPPGDGEPEEDPKTGALEWSRTVDQDGTRHIKSIEICRASTWSPLFPRPALPAGTQTVIVYSDGSGPVP